jgi:hypothetical protein
MMLKRELVRVFAHSWGRRSALPPPDKENKAEVTEKEEERI